MDEGSEYVEPVFHLPVRTGVRVDSVSREHDRFRIAAGERPFEADHVVVASGAHQIPKVPGFASELAPGIVQLHSKEYRDPSQLQDGDGTAGCSTSPT